MRGLYAGRTRLTILSEKPSPTLDPQALALAALGWVLADENRAGRLLALTGLSPEELRAGLGDPAVLGAVLDFLCGNEADLVAAAGSLGVEPAALAHAREVLA